MTISPDINLLIFEIGAAAIFGGFALYGYLHDQKFKRQPINAEQKAKLIELAGNCPEAQRLVADALKRTITQGEREKLIYRIKEILAEVRVQNFLEAHKQSR